MKQTSRLLTTLLPLTLLAPALAHAHAIAGDRVFPATLAIDDPGVSDELTLPQVQLFKATNDDGDHHWTGIYNAEFDKRITDDLGVSVEGNYIRENGGDHGFDNVGVGAKYQLLKNAPHEFLLSVGGDLDIGDTGSRNIAEKKSSATPGVFVGKGFGDLPDSLDWAKPFAVTGQGGYEVMLGGDNSRSIDYGASVQYSLPYLQQHVKDIGLPRIVANMVPIVEFAFSTPTSNAGSKTTGTINPGFIWMGHEVQVGLEAVVPVNSATGHGVGAQAQLHFYLDDIFPHTAIGQPLFGKDGTFK